MARENQGLQIALIISVMLTIILGVATFLVYRQYTDTAISLKDAKSDSIKKQRDLEKARDDGNQLKRMLGVSESESIENLQKQFDEDMKKFGGGDNSPAVQFYRPLVDKLFQTIQDRDRELSVTKDENKQLKDKYELREQGKDGQLKKFDDTVEQVTQDLESRTETFRKEHDRLTEDQNKIKEQLQSARKEMQSATAQADTKYKELDEKSNKIRKMAKQLRTENTQLTSQVMDVPDGKVRWVNQRNKTVWIDLGRDDKLNPLMTFSVYPSDDTDLGKAKKKASIEVTQILESHLAEARILDDDITDPIMPGDKIYTPIWSPGDERHFALAGFMDVNGDGKNNQQLLRNIITMNGGVVDCEVGTSGKLIGEITIKTRFLVLGDRPDEKSEAGSLEGYTKIRSQADNLGIPIISLNDLLSRMGYKPQSHVVHYGADANPKDFRPQAESGMQRVSSGNVSELYKPRDPNDKTNKKSDNNSGNTGGAY